MTNNRIARGFRRLAILVGVLVAIVPMGLAHIVLGPPWTDSQILDAATTLERARLSLREHESETVDTFRQRFPDVEDPAGLLQGKREAYQELVELTQRKYDTVRRRTWSRYIGIVAGVGAAAFLIGWGLVRALGWVVAGFSKQGGD